MKYNASQVYEVVFKYFLLWYIKYKPFIMIQYHAFNYLDHVWSIYLFLRCLRKFTNVYCLLNSVSSFRKVSTIIKADKFIIK